MTIKNGFTLIELLVIVIIIGIVAAIAVPNYMNTKEKAIDKEAQAVLKLIQSGQKQYYAKYEFYFSPGSSAPVDAINGNLSLSARSDLWSYGVVNLGGRYNASATRQGRTWWVNSTMQNATCTGSCV